MKIYGDLLKLLVFYYIAHKANINFMLPCHMLQRLVINWVLIINQIAGEDTTASNDIDGGENGDVQQCHSSPGPQYHPSCHTANTRQDEDGDYQACRL